MGGLEVRLGVVGLSCGLRLSAIHGTDDVEDRLDVDASAVGVVETLGNWFPS